MATNDQPKTPEEVYGDPEDTAEKPQEREAAQPWLDLIVAHDKAGFNDYNERCDAIDKLYADAERLASRTRDSEFQIFWANVQVLKPAIYSRPPIPVVIPRFRDRRPLPRVTSEFLERAIVVTFDAQNVDGVMRQVRDDVAVNARGVAWQRYETGGRGYHGEATCIEWVSRRDFAHDPARSWAEVDWVAKRSWLTKAAMKDRFQKTSGEEYLKATFAIRKDERGNNDGKLKAGVWELWCKSANRVVWISEGCEKCLDDDVPHLDLEGFFPCPQPAYGTVQRGSLIPVPDFVYYQDQISEINALTNRISALSESLKLRGFYPAGAAELGDAIEAAIKATDDNQILVPVSNWAMVGSGKADQLIVWLPIEMVAKTIAELVDLRKQLIEDVYQITGLSDIMRGATDPNETLGAQELKSQYGSVRVRDRQDELVRFARDVTRIAAEIVAENFSAKTLLAMTQMEIPTKAQLAEQAKPIQSRHQQIMGLVQQAMQMPQAVQAAQQNPDRAKQLIGQAQGELQSLQQQVEKIEATPSIEDVMAFLKDQRVRPFVLDIETDSTIAPNEDAQKKRATEFVTAVGGFMGQSVPLVAAAPQLAPLVGEFLKYVASQFRAGRQLEGAIDEFADSMGEMAKQPKPNPEADAAAAKAKADQQRTEAELQGRALDAKLRTDGEQRAAAAYQHDTTIKAQTAEHQTQLRERESAAKIEQTQLATRQAAEKHGQDMEKGALELKRLVLEVAGKEIENRRAATAPTEGEAQKAEAAPKDDATGKAIEALAAAFSAPRQVRIVRDGAGEMTGAEDVR